jgi:hypothetical protein
MKKVAASEPTDLAVAAAVNAQMNLLTSSHSICDDLAKFGENKNVET